MVDVSSIEAQVTAEVTGPNGTFPLALEEVSHFGTVQRYRCWQRGPNSAALLTLQELFNSATDKLDKVFLVFEEERYTYGEVLSQASALARELSASFGVCKGDRIGIASRNYPEWVVAFIAGVQLGAIVLPINSWLQGDELRYALEDSGTKVVFADAERVDAAAGFIEELSCACVAIRCTRPGVPSVGELVARGAARPAVPSAVVGQDDHALLMYTSGTTNLPKGVLSTHRNVMSALNIIPFGLAMSQEISRRKKAASGQSVSKVSAPRLQECTLCPVPLFHATGCHAIFLTSFFIDRKLVLMSKWDPGAALCMIDREKVTTFTGVPTMSYELMSHPDFDKYDTSSLRNVGGGGAAFRASHAGEVQKKFKNAKGSQGFGMTETNAITVANAGADYLRKPTSCGKCHINFDVCILDEQGRKMPAGGTGELCLRGAGIMSEYWNKPEKTKETFHIDEAGELWLRTGDVGTVDDEGFIYILDRLKDLIIRGGENISCAEVESALYEHPAVKEVAAFGLPDERLGETVAAAVVWRPGAAVPTEIELGEFLKGRLASFKTPSTYFAWPDQELPRGATGKTVKKEIRERAKGMPRSKL